MPNEKHPISVGSFERIERGPSNGLARLVISDLDDRIWHSGTCCVDAPASQVLAHPAGYEAGKHESLLDGRACIQQQQSLVFGNVRFAGVPPGRIRIHAWTPSGESKREERVGEGESLRVTMTIR